MRLLFTSTLYLLFAVAARAQDENNTTNTIDTSTSTSPPEQWQGCVDPNNPNAKIEIGKKTIVCLLIGDSTNWAGGVNYTRVSFQPEADQYSTLHIPNSFNDLLSAKSDNIFLEKNITVAAYAQDQLSFVRTYSDDVTQRIYPYLTAIIDVEDGRVRGITWDDACVFCGNSECDEITYNFNGVKQDQKSSGQPTKGCYNEVNQCLVVQENGETLCDLNLFVVWTGTDSNGVAFQSSAYRFSQFPKQEISDRFEVPDVPIGRKMEAVEVKPMQHLDF